MTYLPTEPQLNYLKGLGYRLSPPESKNEASNLITSLKEGKSPEEAERVMLKFRAKQEREWAKLILDDLKDIEKMIRDPEINYRCAGFHLTCNEEADTPEVLQYHDSFLSFELAKKFPLLIDSVGIDCEEVEELPMFGRFIQADGTVTEFGTVPHPEKDPVTFVTIRRKRPRKLTFFGCLFRLFAIVLVLLLSKVVGLLVTVKFLQ